MAEKEGLTIDDVLEQVGSCGFYQIRFILILSYLMGLAVILPVTQLAILTAEPPWKCTTNSSVCNMTGTFRQGDDYYKTRCTLERSDWEFVDSFTSVITEFDLVCDKTFLGSFSSSILFLGWLFAALCGGVIADKFGRKSVMIISSFLTSVFSLLSAFPTVYWLFALIRFVTGFFVGCGCMPLFVVLVEYVGVRHRHMASTCIWFSAATCFLLMSAFAYGIRNWRHLILVTSAMGLPSILFWWLVPESARFLQLKDRFKETETILRKIAVTNNKIYPEKPLVKYNEDGKEQVMGSFKDLFRTRQMTHTTLVSCFSWFVNAMVFYGVVFSSPGLGTNMYVSFALATVVNIPSHALCIYCMGKFGRKKTVVFANIFASLAAIATVLLTMYDPGSNSGYKNGQLVTAILAKMGITISFDGIYVYSAELFPTVIRNVGMGASSASGRVGSFAAPFVISLNYVHVLLPYTIMGAASLLAGVLCWTLPETKSVPTAEVMSSPCQDAKKPSQTDMEDSLL